MNGRLLFECERKWYQEPFRSDQPPTVSHPRRS
jgi:hypothetical protein